MKPCPECGNTSLVHNRDRGEIICRECGLVVEDIMFDFSPEWREFDTADASKRRTGSPLTYSQHDRGLGTQVGNSSDLRALGKNRDKFYRLRKWQQRVSSAIERNLQVALSDIKRISSFLNLSTGVEEEISRIYTLAVQRGLVRGHSVDHIVAGSVYAACKLFDTPRTMSEISEATGLDEVIIGRAYRKVVRNLGLKVLPSDPLDFVDRYASQLGISPRTQTVAARVIVDAKTEGIISGKSPQGIAAAALYLASVMTDERKTQAEIGEVVGVTEVTIRNRYKELLHDLRLSKKMRKKILEEVTISS